MTPIALGHNGLPQFDFPRPMIALFPPKIRQRLPEIQRILPENSGTDLVVNSWRPTRSAVCHEFVVEGRDPFANH